MALLILFPDSFSSFPYISSKVYSVLCILILLVVFLTLIGDHSLNTNGLPSIDCLVKKFPCLILDEMISLALSNTFSLTFRYDIELALDKYHNILETYLTHTSEHYLLIIQFHKGWLKLTKSNSRKALDHHYNF